jgi:hypothetical protein
VVVFLYAVYNARCGKSKNPQELDRELGKESSTWQSREPTQVIIKPFSNYSQ